MTPESHYSWIEILIRLGAALGAGAVIGADREWLHKPAGLKTHMLFALASACMALMALELYFAELKIDPHVNADATRILQGIITGMSFLGAGSIMRGAHRVHGLTTGAGIWLAGALGMLFGCGLYRIGVVTLALGMFTLVFVRLIEPRDIKQRRLEAERRDEAGLPQPEADG